MITDSHIHIGQWLDTYYCPLEILRIVAEQGVKSCAYSSTTSGEKNLRYSKIEKEISSAAKTYSPSKFKPYFWYIQPYIKSGITAKNAFENLPYKGIKLHPKLYPWDFKNKTHLKALHSLFGYASENKLPVLIHTGPESITKPELFEPFFIEYPSVKFTLAHCRPVYESIAMFALYKNVYGDTAFLPKEDLQKIKKAGFANRIILGSDFPLTHYYSPKSKNPKWTLQMQYARDVENMKQCSSEVEYE